MSNKSVIKTPNRQIISACEQLKETLKMKNVQSVNVLEHMSTRKTKSKLILDRFCIVINRICLKTLKVLYSMFVMMYLSYIKWFAI